MWRIITNFVKRDRKKNNINLILFSVEISKIKQLKHLIFTIIVVIVTHMQQQQYMYSVKYLQYRSNFLLLIHRFSFHTFHTFGYFSFTFMFYFQNLNDFSARKTSEKNVQNKVHV